MAPLPKFPLTRLNSGRQLIDGDVINSLLDLVTSSVNTITALAGGALNNLTPVLTGAFCEVTTVATQGDSVVLPPYQFGLKLHVTNSGANAMQVFANGTDQISGVAGNLGVLHFPATSIIYYAGPSGKWTRYVAVGGVNPATEATQFGSGIATFLEEGNINRQIAAAGIQPGATGVDSVLAAYTLPANSFDILGRGLQITAAGSFGATVNNKRVKLIFNPATAVVGNAVGAGGVAIADTGVVTTNGGGWQISANVFKYGANGSNTQIGIHSQSQVGGAVSALLAPSLIAAAENGPILIAVTGNATTAVADIVYNWVEINAMN